MMRNSSKRSFFILIIVIGVAVCLSGFSLFNKQTTPESSESEIKFITPVDGDMLNE
jgi:CHASE3 domain sensor protein